MRRTIHRTIMISFLFWILFITDAYSTVYYLDCNLTSDCKTGNYSKTNRNCTGSDGSAYKALSSLNSILVAGDTVYVRGGTYTSNQYNPSNSGTSGSKITITKYQSETPIFSGATYFYMTKNYHVIDGIQFTGMTLLGASHIRLWGGMYNEIRNAAFSVANPLVDQDGYISILGNVSNSYEGYNTIYNCTFAQVGDNSQASHCGSAPYYGDCGAAAITIGYAAGSPSHHNIIDSCTVTHLASYGIIIYNGSTYNQVKNCTIDQQDSGLGITLGPDNATAHNLIDNNVIKNFATGLNNSKSAIQLYGANNTVRRNRIYNGGASAYAIEMYHDNTNNNLIYNNTIYHGKIGAIALKTSTGNKFYNNIFYGNGYNGGNNWQVAFYWGANAFVDGSNEFDYNYHQFATGSPPLTPSIDYNPTIQVGSSVNGENIKLSVAKSHWPLTFKSHNIENAAGPKFVSEAEYNFNLASDSPCINAGKVVNDADWGNLPYNGSAPDVGALESNFDSKSFSSPSPPSPPKNLRVVP